MFKNLLIAMNQSPVLICRLRPGYGGCGNHGVRRL
jgi:hypothetical protein